MIKHFTLFLLFPCILSAQWANYQFIEYTSGSTGYYFFTPVRQNGPGSMYKNQMVLDARGEIIYYHPLLAANTPDFKLHPNGMISYYKTNKYFLMDSTFTVVDSVQCVGYTTDSHDLQILPNGHYLLLGTNVVVMDLSSYPMFYHNGTAGSTTANVTYNIVQELDTNKNVVFEWHTIDHFQFDDVDENWLFNPFNIDWTHCNAVELDDDGNILLSNRHFNEITKINRSDSSVMWRFGGKRNEFSFLNDTTPFLGQHDIRRNNNGDVSLFDNGYHSTSAPSHPARALEYTLDEVNKTAFLSFAYIHDSAMYSRATGNFQHMPNGNKLVNYGQVTNRNVCFVVIDSTGSKVCELIFPDTLSSYRSFNFQELPWSFHRPSITCIDSAGTFYLDGGAGQSSYLWSDGSTSRFLAITSLDTFSVFTPYGDGGFIRSEKFIVDNLNAPCGPFASINEAERTEDVFQVYPNPAGDKLYLNGSGIDASEIRILNTLGAELPVVPLQMTRGTTFLDIQFLKPGVYFIRAGFDGGTTVKKFTKQ